MIVLSLFFILIFNIYDLGFKEFINIVGPLVCGAGIPLIIMATVEARDWRRSLKSTADDIVQKSTDELKEIFDFLKRRENNGLVDILAPRLLDANTKTIIANEIKKSTFVKIFCISGLDYFRPPKAAVESGVSYGAISKRIDKEQDEFNLKIQALLMNPTSDAGRFRHDIEMLGGDHENINKDIEEAEDGINSLNNKAEAYNPRNKGFIEHRLYDIYPQAYFVITDKYIFIEQYHFAPTSELYERLNDNGIIHHTQETACTGGIVPILQFRADSTMYEAMKLHFETIWNQKSHSSSIPLAVQAPTMVPRS